jgi:energy-coupling factor transporter ATP-binding protein EcfA2
MDVREQPIHDVAEVVGLVQQNPELQFCTLTVQDEVAFGLENRCLPRDEIRERMTWALSIVGAEHLLGRPLATLSGGEKQKVAIAAIMAAKPQVLIFDEPTSNLDPPATAEIFAVIEHIRAKAGITVIVIEHKVEFLLPFQPRLVAMEAGAIISDGPASAADSLPPQRPGRLNTQRSIARPNPRNRVAHVGQVPLVCVEDLHTGYNGHPVLHGVSLKVCPGEFVAVMGDNGSGKTTLLRSLLGLLKPLRGRVRVLDQDTRHSSVSTLAREVGFLFQNPDHQLFADSVWDEAVLALGNFGLLDSAAVARIEELLRQCGLGERGDEHPYRLSYGQKRRLNLISLLAYGPRLFLLDEMLIGQDHANATFLLDMLSERVDAGNAVIMVNHAPRITGRYATRVIFLSGGQVVVDSPAAHASERLTAIGREAYVP